VARWRQIWFVRYRPFRPVFLRVHRSHIVNPNYVVEIERVDDNVAVIIDDKGRTHVPVCRNRAPKFKELLGLNQCLILGCAQNACRALRMRDRLRRGAGSKKRLLLSATITEPM